MSSFKLKHVSITTSQNIKTQTVNSEKEKQDFQVLINAILKLLMGHLQ